MNKQILINLMFLTFGVGTSVVSAGSWRFAVMGDTRGAGLADTPDNPWVNSIAVRAQAEAIVRDGADLVIHSGDMIIGKYAGYYAPMLSEQYAIFTNAMSPLSDANIPIYPIRGNHEIHDWSNDTDAATAWLEVYGLSLPQNGPSNALGFSYSVAHENALFIAIDQYMTNQAGRIPFAWIETQLSSNSLPHVFIFGHEPAFSIGSGLANTPEERNAFWNMLGMIPDHLYLCGHDHAYVRAVATISNSPSSCQLVVGNGGAPKDSLWNGSYPENGHNGVDISVQSYENAENTFGYALFTVSGFHVQVEARVTDDGVNWRVCDAFEYTLTNSAAAHIRDYDGDGKADPALYQPAAGVWQFRLSSNGYALAATRLGSEQSIPISGDYDGDGKADPAVLDAAAGRWRVQCSAFDYVEGEIIIGQPGCIPVNGDYDGDGKSDPAVFLAGVWGIRLSQGDYAETVFSLGSADALPLPADYDGDGLTDPAVFHPASGQWLFLPSFFNYAPMSFNMGCAGWTPVQADFDGDLKADPAQYFPETGAWRIALSDSNYNIAVLANAGIGGVPLPADYDGDGKADPMVCFADAGQWMFWLSTQNYELFELSWGEPSFIPLR